MNLSIIPAGYSENTARACFMLICEILPAPPFRRKACKALFALQAFTIYFIAKLCFFSYLAIFVFSKTFMRIMPSTNPAIP